MFVAVAVLLPDNAVSDVFHLPTYVLVILLSPGDSERMRNAAMHVNYRVLCERVHL